MLIDASPRLMRDQRAEDGSRQRDQDDQGVAEAFVLSRQHQVDDDEREHEGDDQRAALLHVLPALALEVVGEALGQLLLGRRLQEIDGLADRAAGKRHALQRCRVELLEAGQRIGLHRLARPWRRSTAAPARRCWCAPGSASANRQSGGSRAAPAGSPGSCGRTD